MSKEDGLYYAEVTFGPEEFGTYRKFLVALMRLNIIGLADDEVDANVDELEKSKVHVQNMIVLHNEEEKKSFRATMKIFFPEKEFQITDEPGSPSFKEWLERKKNQIIDN